MLVLVTPEQFMFARTKTGTFRFQVTKEITRQAVLQEVRGNGFWGIPAELFETKLYKRTTYVFGGDNILAVEFPEEQK